MTAARVQRDTAGFDEGGRSVDVDNRRTAYPCHRDVLHRRAGQSETGRSVAIRQKMSVLFDRHLVLHGPAGQCEIGQSVAINWGSFGSSSSFGTAVWPCTARRGSARKVEPPRSNGRKPVLFELQDRHLVLHSPAGSEIGQSVAISWRRRFIFELSGRRLTLHGPAGSAKKGNPINRKRGGASSNFKNSAWFRPVRRAW